jgi:hypothetical protein
MKTMPQRGYGLLDVVLAAVLLLGALAGIIVLFNNASLVQSSTRTAQAVTTTTSEIKAMFRVQGDFSDLGADFDTGTARVIRMGIVPEDLIITTQDGSEIMTDFAGDSRIRFRTNPANPAFFDVEISNVPRSACIRLSLENNGVTGPLGQNYEVVADCAAPALPIVATFSL